MTLELVANEDLTMELDIQTNPSDLIYTGDIDIIDPAITSTISTKDKANAKGISTTSLVAVFSLATGAPCPHSSVLYDFVTGTGTILATATKTKAENNLVMRENDASVSGCIGTWKLKATPFTVAPCACDFTLNSAGQTKVKAQ